jgi:hypothetical protein
LIKKNSFASCDSENKLTFYKIPLAANLTTKTSKENDQTFKVRSKNKNIFYKINFYYPETIAKL